MQNEFIPYEQALELKELGFNEHCFAHYCNGDLITKTAILKSSTMLYYQQNNINPNNQYKHQNCTAPLYQQAFRWFRNKHGYLYHITYFDPYKAQTPGNADYQGFVLFPHAGIHKLPKMSYDTYGEAELACLNKLIEIIKNKV